MLRISTHACLVLLAAVGISVAGCGAPAPAAPAVSLAGAPAAPATSAVAVPTPPPAPAPDPAARFPADVLDLKNWYLTLPTGKAGDPDTVDQPQLATYSGRYFGLDGAKDGVVFTADAGGATTSGSTYPRSELREMDGSDKASWSNTTGTHTMTLRQAVTALPPAKPQLVTAQIHDTKSDVMEVRLEGSTLLVSYDDGHRDLVLDPAYRLGTPYDLRIVATAGRIDVAYNGAVLATIDQAGSGWYFKTGCYLQSNTDKGDQPDATGSVTLYALQVTHSG